MSAARSFLFQWSLTQKDAAKPATAVDAGAYVELSTMTNYSFLEAARPCR